MSKFNRYRECSNWYTCHTYQSFIAIASLCGVLINFEFCQSHRINCVMFVFVNNVHISTSNPWESTQHSFHLHRHLHNDFLCWIIIDIYINIFNFIFIWSLSCVLLLWLCLVALV